MRIFLIFLFFLFVSGLLIISNEKLHLSKGDEAMEFGRLYYSWMVGTGENIFKATGYFLKLEWMPDKDEKNITRLS